MAKEYKLSPERLIELQCEQYYLTTIREKEVAELLKEARSFGDLSENSEYDEAKNEQGRLHSRIAELDNILSNYILNKISREQLEEMKQTLADLQAEETPRTFPSEFVVSWDGMDEHNLQSLSNYYLSCLEKFLSSHIDIEEDDGEYIRLGSTVTVLDKEFDEELTYKIVGSQEADPMNGAISEDSPFGKALLGKNAGDNVTVDAPAGPVEYQILKVER